MGKTHWFILYGFYQACEDDRWDDHENDFEGILLVVRRPPLGESGTGTLEVMATEQHGEFFNYRSPSSQWGASDGLIQSEQVDGFDHPIFSDRRYSWRQALTAFQLGTYETSEIGYSASISRST